MAFRGTRFPQPHEPRGIVERQRPKEDRMDDAEDRGAAADAESESQRGRDREDWRPAQCAPRQPDVEWDPCGHADPSVVTQRGCGIDPCRAVRGQPCGNQRNQQQNERSGKEDEWIRWIDVVEEHTQRTARGKRKRDPKEQPGRDEDHHVSHDDPDHVAIRCPSARRTPIS